MTRKYICQGCVTVAYNVNSLQFHDGLPYAHLSREALAYYVAEGLIVERAERGRFNITAKGREFIASQE